jgi:hypothetical protein
MQPSLQNGLGKKEKIEKESIKIGRGYAIATIAGILAGAVFGRVWLALLANVFLGWQHSLEVGGWVVLLLFLAASIWITLRVFRKPVYRSGQLPIRTWYIWFVILIIVEIRMIALGNLFLQENNVVNWKPAWILFIVGAHFWGFAFIFRIRSFNWLAATTCSASVLSVLMSRFFQSDSLLYFLTGLSGALSLWGFTGWALYRMANGRWIDI